MQIRSSHLICSRYVESFSHLIPTLFDRNSICSISSIFMAAAHLVSARLSSPYNSRSKIRVSAGQGEEHAPALRGHSVTGALCFVSFLRSSVMSYAVYHSYTCKQTGNIHIRVIGQALFSWSLWLMFRTLTRGWLSFLESNSFILFSFLPLLLASASWWRDNHPVLFFRS